MFKHHARFTILSLLLALALALSACGGATATPAASTGGKLKVFGAFATPLEEPWDNAIHTALQAAQQRGDVEYTWSDNIGYAGDMERVLREEATKNKPDMIFG
ncbi:MAG: BMP family ABC transporter substrate-binding protein, partial [Chloroflexi bacterium]|nr:BMP family ABC transporter substrate-binding protein [Chloroflexota bacterium]